MFKKLRNPDLGILFVRLGVGLIFVWHGVLKATSMAGTVGFFDTLGLPAFMAYIVTGIEVLGGVAMILGTFVGWAGIGLAAVMIGAIWTVKFPKGFIGGFELDYMLLLASSSMLFTGAGKYSVQHLICRNGRCDRAHKERNKEVTSGDEKTE